MTLIEKLQENQEQYEELERLLRLAKAKNEQQLAKLHGGGNMNKSLRDRMRGVNDMTPQPDSLDRTASPSGGI